MQRNRESGGYLGRTEIGTNEHGVFVMTNLAPEETYVVYVPMQSMTTGFVQPKFVTTAGGDAYAEELTVVPGRCIAGRVIVPQGESIPPKTQILLDHSLPSDAREAEIREDGSFEFHDAPTGTIELVAQVHGLQLVEEIPAGGDVSDVRLVFERP